MRKVKVIYLSIDIFDETSSFYTNGSSSGNIARFIVLRRIVDLNALTKTTPFQTTNCHFSICTNPISEWLDTYSFIASQTTQSNSEGEPIVIQLYIAMMNLLWIGWLIGCTQREMLLLCDQRVLINILYTDEYRSEFVLYVVSPRTYLYIYTYAIRSWFLMGVMIIELIIFD